MIRGFAASIFLMAASVGMAQNTTFDVLVNLNDMSTNGYYISSFSPASANVATTGSAALNPTMTLQVGKRYKFSYTDASNHPFEIIAKDPSFSDTVLLSLGQAGTLEGDSGIEWVEQPSGGGTDFYFTLTPTLASAMSAGGKTPGFRCFFHPTIMRGSINPQAASGVEKWRQY